MKSADDPQWPQPPGIFENGDTFHPVVFLKTLREVYETVVIQKSDGGDNAMEIEAFVKMLYTRMITIQGRCFFKVFPLTIPLNTPSELFFEHEGTKYLRLDCLRQTDSGSEQ